MSEIETRIETGQILWTPTEAFKTRSNLHQFELWLKQTRGLEFANYQALWDWSVTEPDAFWRSIWDYFDILSDAPPSRILEGAMPNARWFAGSRVNYAEHVLRGETHGDADRTVIRHSSELRPLTETSWRDLGCRVRKLATRLRVLGIGPGDRVVAYMPNIIETVIAMLASTAIGAIWSTAAPEFGTGTVVDRFGQIEPKLIFVADGYRYGGKDFNRGAEISAIVASVPSIEAVVWMDYLGQTPTLPDLGRHTIRWETLFDGPEIPQSTFAFERVPSDHPLWILFSSGTTGLPKAIVHGHQGILVESYKTAAFHFNIKAGDCLFFYSTTGWMMWNTLMNAPLMDAVAVLYDGHPSHPDPSKLWALADAAGATAFGTNPTLTQIMRKMEIHPNTQHLFERLESVMLVGSPATPDAFGWVYDTVKPGLWVTSQSGGTEFCSGLLAGVPSEPVKAGQINAPALGVAARTFDDHGDEIFDQPGELVVTQPMPSMPLFLWGDTDGARYRSSYFDRWPGIWRHGDLAQINRGGGCFVFGRSDATLNRHGVRIGSAEIYRTMDGIKGVVDSLVVCIEQPDGGYYMPLFVSLSDGATLDDALITTIKTRLRIERSPRHVPDEIVQAPAIPATLTGKKMEIPVRKLLMGHLLADVVSEGAAKDPSALHWFAAFGARRFLEGKPA
jgi:acetoacetyl-CoA synthetase